MAAERRSRAGAALILVSVLLTAPALGFRGIPPVAAEAAVGGSADPVDRAVDALVSTASPAGIHPRNAQPEPPLAVDPTRPNVLVSGANDLVDMQPCSQKASSTGGGCAFPLDTFNQGVGLSAAYFSFDSAHTWIQPTYRGLTAVDCDPTVEPCKAHPGPIHTVPNFYESGLRSRSDTGVAFGPVPRGGKFSWGNGSRLYFATDTTNLDDSNMSVGSWSGTFAITVSHIDNVTPERIHDQSNWSRPHFVPGHPATVSELDKPQVWADNAASSPFFGRAYACFDDFGSLDSDWPMTIDVAVSTDGGDTWRSQTITGAVSPQHGIYDGCTVRTDSHGVVYMFVERLGATSLRGGHTLVKSFDGGRTWTKPADAVRMTDICFEVDPVTGNCIEDGVAGARVGIAAAPSVSIANGAPTGADATDEIVDAWSDGAGGPGHEKTVISTSMDGAATWSHPSALSLPEDRSMYAAAAISPDGKRLYVAYMGLLQPFQRTTKKPRLIHGVMRTSRIGKDGLPTHWETAYNGPPGDARGSSQGRILYNEFLGDYVYAVATRDAGVGVWTDVRRSADCPAMDAWRQASYDAAHVVFPAPWPGDCPPHFGNSDIFSASTG